VADPHRLGRVRRDGLVVLLVIAIGIAVAAVASHDTHRRWYSSGDSACGPPGMVRVAGRVTPVGERDGDLVRTARTVHVRVGARIDVHMVEDALSSTDAPDIPLPSSTNTIVLQRVGHDTGGATATYRALEQGVATLMSATRFCSSDQSNSVKRCPVLHVIVTN
jgi:hypothetical protein